MPRKQGEEVDFRVIAMYIPSSIGWMRNVTLLLINDMLVISLISDVNECLSNNGNCSHDCDNSDGTYRCSCPGGFTLDDNSLSCSGKRILSVV